MATSSHHPRQAELEREAGSRLMQPCRRLPTRAAAAARLAGAAERAAVDIPRRTTHLFRPVMTRAGAAERLSHPTLMWRLGAALAKTRQGMFRDRSTRRRKHVTRRPTERSRTHIARRLRKYPERAEPGAGHRWRLHSSRRRTAHLDEPSGIGCDVGMETSAFVRLTIRCAVLALVGALGGCDSVLGYQDIGFTPDAGADTDQGGSGDTGGSSTGGTSAAGTDTGGSSTGGTSAAGTDTGGSSTGGTSAAGSDTGGSSTGGSSTGGSPSAGSGGGTDPLEQYRQDCVNRINELRATKGLPAYQRWTSAETCVDQQATYDEQHGQPHAAWQNHAVACDGYGSAQNECQGAGGAGIVGCMDSMWAEKDQAGCSGCDACDYYTIIGGACPNCSFYGPPTCGHYINMSAKMFSQVGCGFSSLGGWAAQDYQ